MVENSSSQDSSGFSLDPQDYGISPVMSSDYGWTFFAVPVVFVFLLFLSHRANRRKRLMKGLPTSKVSGVFMGLVELKGRAVSADPLCSYLSEKECVWYNYRVEEEWRRVVTTVSVDSKGRVTTRRHVQTGWETLYEAEDMQGFYLEDDTGVILVWPEGAEVDGKTVLDATCRPDNYLYYGKGPRESIADSTGRRRFRELVIETGDILYIVGQARERQDVVAPEIAEDKRAPFYLISTNSEESHVNAKTWESWLWVVFGLFFAVGLPLWGMSERLLDQNWIFVSSALYLMLWGLTWLWSVYNALVDLKNRVYQAASLVEVQLQRRFELIPRLCNVASGYQQYEQSVMEVVTELRAQKLDGGGLEANVSGVAPRLLAVGEAYPELKADAVFALVSEELVKTENRIALSREYFNTIVTHYNTGIQVFPESLIAQIFKLKPQALLPSNDFARAAVKVDFATTPDAPPSESLDEEKEAALE